MKVSRILIGALMVLGQVVYAQADDLALVSINSQTQCNIATRIFGHAFARSGNRFLVLVTDDLKDSLRVNDLTSEVIL